MSRYRFELAGPADDADLRRVLAETPMPGRVAVAFRREPSYFEAAVVDGTFRQVVAARDTESGRIVGFGSRSVGERFVNGQPKTVGYLSSLRLLEAHRNRGLVARGYAFFRRLHADGRTRLYLTTIAEGNDAALALLTSGRAGLPAYHFAGRYHTWAVPLARRRDRRAAGDVLVRPAKPEELSAVLGFLQAVGPRRQFFPAYHSDDFFTPEGLLRGLRPEDLLLAWRHGRLAGILAAWDQHEFRQTVVHGYGGLLRWARPACNAWARLRGRPRLPTEGEPFRYLTAALPLVAGDDATVFAALLDAVLGQRSGGEASHLLIGLHEADPLLPVVRSHATACYTTRLYLVCWDDGDRLRQSLDGRPPYLELGAL